MCHGLLAPFGFRAQVTTQPRPKPASREEKRPEANIRVDTDLVLVPVTVCDPLNRPVTGLEKEHFKIFDDRIEQAVTHFSMDDEPVAVGLVFDVSGSMGPKLARSRQAAAAFFKTASPEDDSRSSTTHRSWWCPDHQCRRDTEPAHVRAVKARTAR
jgi:hypothetical protein